MVKVGRESWQTVDAAGGVTPAPDSAQAYLTAKRTGGVAVCATDRRASLAGV
jgi:hypothetical protein